MKELEPFVDHNSVFESGLGSMLEMKYVRKVSKTGQDMVTHPLPGEGCSVSAFQVRSPS